MSESRLYKQTMDGGEVTKWGAYKSRNYQMGNLNSGPDSKDVLYNKKPSGKPGKIPNEDYVISSWENDKYAGYTTRKNFTGNLKSYD